MQIVLEPNSIPAPGGLAKALKDVLKNLALDAAVFVQQVHYWICKGAGMVDKAGKRWVYNSYGKWIEQLPWLSEYQFRKMTSGLIELGIIEKTQFNSREGARDQGRDRTCWYTINYGHEFFSSTDASVEILTVPSVDLSSDVIETETTPEITPNTATAPAVVEKAKSCEARRTEYSARQTSRYSGVPPRRQTFQEEEVPEEKEEQREIDCELRRLRINPSAVRQDIRRYRSNLPGALARVKKAILDGWCQNPTGLLRKTLKEGCSEEFQPVALPEYPHPTKEQLNELGALGKLVHTVLREPGYPRIVAVDTGRAIVPWWVALGISISNKGEKDNGLTRTAQKNEH